MKTMKVLTIRDYLHLECIKINNNSEPNPYRLYLFFHEPDKHGYWTEHKRQLAKYGNIQSILCHITDMYNNYVQFKPIDEILAWNKRYYGK